MLCRMQQSVSGARLCSARRRLLPLLLFTRLPVYRPPPSPSPNQQQAECSGGCGGAAITRVVLKHTAPQMCSPGW